MLRQFIFDSFKNKELIQYLISLDGEMILAYCSMPGSESDLHSFRFFLKGTFFRIIIDVLIYLY